MMRRKMSFIIKPHTWEANILNGLETALSKAKKGIFVTKYTRDRMNEKLLHSLLRPIMDNV